MEGYQVEIVLDVWKKDIPDIDKKIADDLIRILISKLSREPLKYGAPLRHTLRGYRKLKISKYRVIYRIEKDRVIVFRISIRDSAYE